MGTIISFFVGIVFIAAGNNISSLVNVEWAGLVCDVVGGGLMILGAKLFIDSRKEDMKKRLEIINYLRDIAEKVMTFSQAENIKKQIDVLCENQNSFRDTLVGLDRHLAEIEERYQQNAYKNSDGERNAKLILSSLSELKNGIETLLGNMSNQVSSQLEKQVCEMQAVNQSIKDKGDIIYKASKTETEHIDNVAGKVELFNKLPIEILESADELIDKINKYIEDSSNKFEQLLDDLYESDKKRTDRSNKILNEIRDSNVENNEQIATQIGKLGEEYLQFQKIINSIVNQMTLMSEKDYEIMKGFING